MNSETTLLKTGTDTIPQYLDIKKANLHNGTIIEYGEVLRGDNPNLCFVIPGSFSTLRSWNNVVGAMTERFGEDRFGKFICVTPFGMGESNIKKDSTHFDVAKAYFELIQEISPSHGKIMLIAHSKADLEVLILCSVHLKDRVERIVLSSPVMTLKKNWLSMFLSLVSRSSPKGKIFETLKLVRESLRTSFHGVEFQLDEMNLSRDIDLHDYMKNIAIPVLVIGGEHDIATPDELRQCADAFQNSKVNIVLSANHQFPYYHPDKFADAIWNWIESQSRRSPHRPSAAGGHRRIEKKK